MKKYYIILVLIIVYIFGAYLLSLDETNKYSKFLKDNTPVKFKSFVKETLFFIPYSKREIKKLNLMTQELSENNRKIMLERDKYKNLLDSGLTKRENIIYKITSFHQQLYHLIISLIYLQIKKMDILKFIKNT